MNSPGQRARDPLRRSILCTVLAAGALVLSVRSLADPDLWGHVRFGQDLLAGGGLPATCTHTFTAPDHPWINQEYLSEVIFAAVAAFSGPPGLLILKCLLGLGVLALMIAAADRHAVTPLVMIVVIMLAAYNVAPGWNVRPHIFTYALFALMIAILDRRFAPRECAQRASPRELWLVPPLFAPWANLHGGFFAGVCALTLYLLCRSGEAVWRDGRGAARQVAEYGMLVAAAGLMTLLNPYGVHLLSWLLRAALQPPTDISEWLALHVGDLRFIPFILLLGLAAAAWIFSRASRDTTQTVLLVVTAWQSFAHVRHIPFFAVLAGFWVPPHLEDLRLRLHGEPPQAQPHPPAPTEARPPADRPPAKQRSATDRRSVALTARWMRATRAAVWLTAIVLVAVLAVCSRAVWVDKSMYPVQTFEFMAAHRLEGRLVVQIDWAQYAIDAFAPETTVAFDLRLGCYPQTVADIHWNFFLGSAPDAGGERSTPEDGMTEVLRMGEPNLVLLNRRFPHPIEIMQIERLRALVTQVQPDWVLLYQDELAQLWGRRQTYDDPRSPAYLPPAQRRITEEPQSGFVRWPALPAKHSASQPRPLS